jgi:hypothetical protein
MTMTGENRNLEKNSYQCHFVHYKSHTTEFGMNLGRDSEKPTINSLIYGMALVFTT